MCNRKKECLRPKESKGDPEKCSAEQIKKCHGEEKDHPCVTKDKK